jgi:type IV pilus assembly protein PilV
MEHTAMNPTAQRRAAQSGFSMIEVLVSLVIFAFGMLGLAGLQTRSLAFSQTSLYRSQAAALTDDILDRMRADRTNAKNGSWNTTVETASSSITGTLIYQADLKDWKLSVEQLLPGGAAAVEVAAGLVTVTVQWDERRVGGDGAQQFVTKSRL